MTWCRCCPGAMFPISMGAAPDVLFLMKEKTSSSKLWGLKIIHQGIMFSQLSFGPDGTTREHTSLAAAIVAQQLHCLVDGDEFLGSARPPTRTTHGGSSPSSCFFAAVYPQGWRCWPLFPSGSRRDQWTSHPSTSSEYQ